METRNLKKSLRDQLIGIDGVDRAYEYTRVPKTAKFPYVTYNMTTSGESLRDPDTDIDITLDIDILDYKEDYNTLVIDNLLDTVNTAINRLNVIESTFYYRIERTAILTQLPTPNEFTFRRQISCVLRYMERSS